MQNETVKVTAKNKYFTTLSWLSTEADTSWVFIDGKLIAGPITGTEERSIDITVDTKYLFCVEVQDFSTIEQPEADYPVPNVKPYIHWDAVADASRYRIYHRHADDAEESKICERMADSVTAHFMQACPFRLKHGINYFHVEAVDAAGNESTVVAWEYEVIDLPPCPTAITVSTPELEYLVDDEGNNLVDDEGNYLVNNIGIRITLEF
jgi:hypothetical protein